MIVASLLLIPVAVVFLALGFINGSSSLLIAAIVVSLLIAVALVLSARQAATRRVPARESDRLRDPGWEERPGPMPEPQTPDSPQYSSSAEYSESAAYSPSAQYAESAQYAGGEDSSDPYAGNSASAETTFAGESALADQVGAAVPEPEHPGPADDEEAWEPAERAHYADSDSAPDYDHAASTIGAARAPESEDPSWRRPAEAEDRSDEGQQPDEFGEPDDDDPDDEPLPQSVRPADAVLVARLDAEVLVVDGRPRYHMADCPHLVGRLTEPLPVNEAVELGFSPCGLCRPVDRLVAAVAPH
ncbi:hypothetical protein ACTI_36410 [Actinoplanes sp. OR16]|uniref:hypothetical protein n=1 Tax=Actinoplanes sp. OR16 TaxID=946334 RepID=UPI000F6DEB78|nr:hypothetical protein [Actinoplanes sp. OR16]BBH66956.1 hypothetical protein ACTI_36410 [Actinoplanes sp. OR16]